MGDSSTAALFDSNVTSAPVVGTAEPAGDPRSPAQPLTPNVEKNIPAVVISKPPPPVREDLVDTAVKFLTNPKVLGTPVEQKREFLTKKGLTPVEIDAALVKAGTPNPSSVAPLASPQPGVAPPGVVPGGYQGAPGQYNGTVALPQYPGYYPVQVPPPGQYPPSGFPGLLPYQQPRTVTSRLQDYANMAVIFGGFGYICYRGIRSYLRRFHGFKSSEERRMELLEQSMCQLQDTTKFVTDSLSQLTEAIRDQQRTLETFVTGQMATSNGPGHGLESAVRDVQKEVGIVKSLMLSRSQFPALPGGSPSSNGTMGSLSAGNGVGSKTTAGMNGHSGSSVAGVPTLPAWQLEGNTANDKLQQNDEPDYAAAVVNGGHRSGGNVLAGEGLDSEGEVVESEDDSPV